MQHPLHSFHYCPRCGQTFVVNDVRSKRCQACGFTYYHNSSAAVAAFLLNEDGELLVARRALEPHKGTLDLPGGFVDPGESLEDALQREMKEETGLVVTPGRFLFSLPNVYRYSEFDVHTTDAFFLCHTSDVQVVAHDDVAALTWVLLSDVRPEDFGLASVRRAVSLFLSQNA